MVAVVVLEEKDKPVRHTACSRNRAVTNLVQLCGVKIFDSHVVPLEHATYLMLKA